ncbi:hypothetical protein CC1G_00812 [Coprinopsis cinerea okayama7|uniref:Uncharacterized protein n=1 Tax=Coprinopsis cinerea (strain Okayama-7 / 130 / ATCC MYA-4618 / FGSC 9003) TaxID=240176 RepID=A8N8T7_COPC7|nr:hypothetical protein CC1G_00812 [Coprinopsis cinerea okayama7\|eukprot:XP_001831265.2 hypothetical protein CC1G_00812 [Coprinopsis cinerea okayama7\
MSRPNPFSFAAARQRRLDLWLSQPPSAARRVLYNPDLVELILQHIFPSETDQQQRTRYVSKKHAKLRQMDAPHRKMRILPFVFVCKGFYSPASSLLWEEMESLVPLLTILPIFVFEKGVLKLKDNWVQIPIPQSTLTTFQFYGSKIRRLVPGHRGPRISRSAARSTLTLLKEHGVHSICPALHSVVIARRDTPTFTLLARSPITNVAISSCQFGEKEDAFYRLVFDRLSEQGTFVRNITIDSQTRPSSLPPALRRPGHALQRVEKLSIHRHLFEDPSSLVAWLRDLSSSSPNLTQLHLGVSVFDRQHTSRLPDRVHEFPELKTLHLECHPDAVDVLFSATSFANLTDFVLVLNHDLWHPEHIPLACQEVMRICKAAPSVRRIRIEGLVQHDAILPFFSLPALESFAWKCEIPSNRRQCLPPDDASYVSWGQKIDDAIYGSSVEATPARVFSLELPQKIHPVELALNRVPMDLFSTYPGLHPTYSFPTFQPPPSLPFIAASFQPALLNTVLLSDGNGALQTYGQDA